MRQIAKDTRHETPAEGRYRRLFAERRKGESWAALAARDGVAPGTLAWWRHELRRRDAARKRSERGGPALLPVRVVATATLAPSSPSPDAHGYEVVLLGAGASSVFRRGSSQPRCARSSPRSRVSLRQACVEVAQKSPSDGPRHAGDGEAYAAGGSEAVAIKPPRAPLSSRVREVAGTATRPSVGSRSLPRAVGALRETAADGRNAFAPATGVATRAATSSEQVLAPAALCANGRAGCAERAGARVVQATPSSRPKSNSGGGERQNSRRYRSIHGSIPVWPPRLK